MEQMTSREGHWNAVTKQEEGDEPIYCQPAFEDKWLLYRFLTHGMAAMGQRSPPLGLGHIAAFSSVNRQTSS